MSDDVNVNRSFRTGQKMWLGDRVGNDDIVKGMWTTAFVGHQGAYTSVDWAEKLKI